MSKDFAIDLDNIDSLADQLSSLPQSGEVVEDLRIETLKRGKFQPRHDMDPQKLNEIAESIKSQGVLQPLIIRRVEDGFEIVAGHRRARAAKMAGLETVPCLIREINDQAAMAMSLIENIDREDISLFDEVYGVSNLVKEFGAKKASELLGKKAQWVSKRTKISKAPSYILDFMKIGYSTDSEGFYLLAKLAEKNKNATKKLIDKWEADPTVRMSLRGQVQNLLNDQMERPEKQVEPPVQIPKTTPGSGPVINETAPDSESSAPTHAGNKRGRKAGEKKEALPPIVIKSATKDGENLVLITNEGPILFELAEGAAASITKALKK